LVKDHPDRPFTDLRTKAFSCFHDSIFSRNEAS
jgi:hypothetical protein